MQITNTKKHFGLVAILLHWIIAILIIGLLAEGLYMVKMAISLEKLKFFGWHKEYGILVLLLVVARTMWRIGNITPELDLPWWEVLAARSVHLAFYAFMFALPITGWLITSSAGLPVSFFGWFVLPDLVTANPEHMEQFEFFHKWLGYALILTICMHTAAALKHHFIDKDDILRRMLS
jgi:cytochrome b561